MSDLDFEVGSDHSDSSVEMLSDRGGGGGAPKLVFRDEHNFSIGFVFHRSVDKDARAALTRDITTHGGIVLDSAQGADTLLIGANEKKALVQFACSSSRIEARARLRVEKVSFVRRCIKRGVFFHSALKITAMRGVPEGNGRVAFTEEDFENLCWYISRLIPDPQAGGRQSLNFYSTLTEIGRVDPEYKWAKRHPAESWKENYKKNKLKYKIRIQEMVNDHPPNPGRRWIHDRRLTKASLRSQLGAQSKEEEEEETEESQPGSQDEDDIISQFEPASRKRRRSTNTPRTLRTAAKRPRISQNSKSKEKATEMEESEEEQRNSDKDSLFGIGDDSQFEFLEHEPGPSGGYRSPERTLVASASNNPSAGRPNNFPTQATLVDATARTPPSTNVFGARKQANLSAVLPKGRTTRVSHPDTSIPPWPSQVSPISRSSQLMPPPSEQPPRNTYRPPAKAARRKPVQPTSPVDVPAPYRNTRQSSRRIAQPRPVIAQPNPKPGNEQRTIPQEEAEGSEKARAAPVRATRARSRMLSVEPVIMPLPKRRNARKKQANPVHEEPDKEQDREPPIGETLAEELDVANLLVVESNDISVVQPHSWHADRGISMDTDDAHIAHDLRAASVTSSAARRSNFDFLTQHPTDVLKRIQSLRRHSKLPGASMRSPLGAPTPSQISGPRRTPRRPRQSAPSHLRNETPRRSQLATPHTPLRDQRGSSTESFPLTGTRARAVLHALQQRESDTPYKPLVGTRAAAFAGKS